MAGGGEGVYVNDLERERPRRRLSFELCESELFERLVLKIKNLQNNKFIRLREQNKKPR